ncbi:MAG: 30S ribosomal protein S14, partial [Bacteroidota bacterium]
MAKESMKARERKRERLTARYAKKREELTKILKSTDPSDDVQAAKWDAMIALQKLPANSSKIRKHNR